MALIIFLLPHPAVKSGQVNYNYNNNFIQVFLQRRIISENGANKKYFPAGAFPFSCLVVVVVVGGGGVKAFVGVVVPAVVVV